MFIILSCSLRTMERVLYNIHSQVCGTVLRQTTSKTRRLLEFTVLFAAVCGFSVLFVSHVSFVYRKEASGTIPHACFESVPKFQPESDIIHVHILDESQQSFALPMDDSCMQTEVQFSFSKTRGFLLLPPDKLKKHNITSQLVGVSKSNTACFGEPFLQRIVFELVGTETVVTNWLLVLGDGYIYNYRTSSIEESMSTNHLSLWRTPGWSVLIDKAGVVLTSIFLFFITTTLTSFMLRETQQRMLEFTIQLQNHVREERSLGRLIFMHVMSNLVFVPIMVGMMFFLIEFYGGDKVLAFMVSSIFWISEVYSIVSLRSQEGIEFFPRIFFLLFLGFHVYIFSCPHGFTYTALSATFAFLLHSMLFFWNRYELPAVAHGLVNPQHPRMSGSAQSSPERRPSPLLPRNGDTQTQEPIHLEPRLAQRESHHSMSTMDRSVGTEINELSRPSSGLFQPEDDGDSCLYMLSGEIVMHRRSRSRSNSPASSHRDERRRRATSGSEDTIPLEVETSSPPIPDLDLTPRRSSRNNEEPEGLGPPFPF